MDDEHTMPNSTELGDRRRSLPVAMSEDPCCKFKNMETSIGKDAIDGPDGDLLLE
jgi:hypothetical protein